MGLFSTLVVLTSALATTLVEGSLDGNAKIRGVNLGGWLILEPWITPSIFEPYLGQPNPPVDEYMLTKRLGKVAKAFMERHWSSFVTKSDFIKLAAAGINSVRIPVGYWAVDIQEGEPWVEGSFRYLEQGIQWAREVGFKVMIDVHGAPGSQNGLDNSGRFGEVHFFEEANIIRHLDILTNLTNHFTQAHYNGVVTSIELVNEPFGILTDYEIIKTFYTRGINRIRELNSNITIVVHDAFIPLEKWEYLKHDQSLSSRVNLMYDTHLYQTVDLEFVNMEETKHLNYTCVYHDPIKSANDLYPTVVGEWSLATTDCTKYLAGFPRGTRYEGTYKDPYFPFNVTHPIGSCSKFDDLTKFPPKHKGFLKDYFRQQVGVFESAGSGWYFWNFKAENSPEWNFLMGVEQGWINLHEPISPRC